MMYLKMHNPGKSMVSLFYEDEKIEKIERYEIEPPSSTASPAPLPAPPSRTYGPVQFGFTTQKPITTRNSYLPTYNTMNYDYYDEPPTNYFYQKEN